MHPDMMKPLRGLLTAAAASNGYAVGYWYWELEFLPRAWDDALARVDEIWVASDFVAEAMRRATHKPIIKIPPPIEVTIARAYSRSDFDLSDDRFLFLFSFVFNSLPKTINHYATI